PDRLGPLAALGDVDHDALPLVKAGHPRALQRRGMDEHILAAAVAHDEAEARPRPAGGRGRGAAVHAEHFRHLWTALPRGDPDLERLAGLHCRDPAAPEHAGMEERIAGSVALLDKAEPLFRVEPFDHGLDRGARGLLKPCCAVSRRRTEFAWRKIVIVLVEAAPPPLPITSIRFQCEFPVSSRRVPIARPEIMNNF